MTLKELGDLAATLGFPALVALYLLIRFDLLISRLNRNIEALLAHVLGSGEPREGVQKTPPRFSCAAPGPVITPPVPPAAAERPVDPGA